MSLGTSMSGKVASRLSFWIASADWWIILIGVNCTSSILCRMEWVGKPLKNYWSLSSKRTLLRPKIALCSIISFTFTVIELFVPWVSFTKWSISYFEELRRVVKASEKLMIIFINIGFCNYKGMLQKCLK